MKLDVWRKGKGLIFLWRRGHNGMKKTAVICKTVTRKRQKKRQGDMDEEMMMRKSVS